jgi:hypothetical protein
MQKKEIKGLQIGKEEREKSNYPYLQIIWFYT